MWLLTNDGSLFDHKRLWLRPGTTHLLGRTTGKAENGERISYIEHKTVSRKHLTIVVHAVKAGSGTRLHERSKLELRDGSKIGTVVDCQEKIVGSTKVVEGTKCSFKLGQYEHAFHLVWEPVVLCHSGGSKSKDPLKEQREVLERADVKVLKDYVANVTTHSVAKKRNTAANLQALVQGRWVIGEGWASALAEAVSAGGADGMSALEGDFDSWWPQERKFLVPAGTEPVKRPDDFYLPNPERVEVFSEFTFLFLVQSQYDTLLPVVTSGSGKALLWEVDVATSKVDDLVDYVKGVAGHKGATQFRLSQLTGPGGVVVVRPNERDEVWRKFIKGVEVAVCQRSIEQNELLDVILSLDTSSLRQPLKQTPPAPPPDGDRQASPTPDRRPQRQSQRAITVNESPPAAERPAQNEQQLEDAEQQEEQPAPTTRKRQRRYVTQSRFKGFDEDFDPSQFSKPASQSPAPSFDHGEPSQAPSAQGMDIDESSQAEPMQRNSRKRPVEEAEEPDEEAMYAALLPGHAAVKRQKTEAAARNGNREAIAAQEAAAGKTQAKKKKAKQLDVMAEIQNRREKEEEERRKDEESLKNAMEGIDLSELKNLAQIEEMEIPVREPPARRGAAASANGHDDRWNPVWNGRKNFKKFRAQGSAPNGGPRIQRVIVALEEVPRRGQGIGDEYWLQPSSRTSKGGKSQSQSQKGRSQRSATVPDDGEDEEDDQTRFRRRLETSRREDEERARADVVYAEEIAGRARDERLQAAAVRGTPSQTLRGESQQLRKRPAAVQASGGPAKRVRQTQMGLGVDDELAGRRREVVDLDGDEDDELKFRRRRRG